MRKLLNTLFITNEEAFLKLDQENVVIIEGQKILARFPLHILEEIFIFSWKGCTPALMGECSGRNIGVAFFTPNGRFLCRIQGKSHGNVLLRKQQYRLSESYDSLQYAKNIILGKIYNSKYVLKRMQRDHPMQIPTDRFSDAVCSLDQYMQQIQTVRSKDELRSLEGNAAEKYYSLFDYMILNQKQNFYFHNRNRRPPVDNVNALLSFGYVLLARDYANALESVGLDSYVGFMHTDRPGRESLALDLEEELRAPFVDKFILTLINQKQIKESDFIKREDGKVELTQDGRKKFFIFWQKRKKITITHPFIKEKVEWGLVPYVQSLLLARSIRGDLDQYAPFFWRG